MPEINNGTVGFFGAIGDGSTTTLARRFAEGTRDAFYGAYDNAFGQTMDVIKSISVLHNMIEPDINTSMIGEVLGNTELKQKLIEEFAKDKDTIFAEGEVTLDDVYDIIQSIAKDYKEDALKMVILDKLPSLGSACPTMTTEQITQTAKQLRNTVRNAVKLDREGDITDCKYDDVFELLVNKYNLNDTKLFYGLKDAESRKTLDDPVGEAHFHGDELSNDGNRIIVTLVKCRTSVMPVEQIIFTIDDTQSYLPSLMELNGFDGDHMSICPMEIPDYDYKNIKDDKPKYKFNKHNGCMTMQSNQWYDVGHKRGKGGSKKGRKKR